MKLGSKLIAVGLLFVGLVAVNYLASSLPARLDATGEKIYTLSPGTKALLDKLEEPVKLEFYFTRSVAGLPINFKNYAARVQEMLRQYVRASRGKLELTVIDPKTDTPAEEKATAAGLSGQPMSNGETIYFGLVATQADQQKTVGFFNPQREQFLEYDLSQLLFSVQQFDRRKLGLISGVPLRAQPDYMAMQSGRMPQSQFIISEWEKVFEIVNVEATATELPANLDVLAVIHPQNLPPKLQFAIDQFLLAGKPVFLAVDPASRQMRSRTQQMGMFGGPQPGAASDLPMLPGWGLSYNAQNVVGDLDNATQVQTGPGQLSRFPVWLSLTKEEFNRTALPTSQLDSLLFVEPGSISLKPDTKNLTFTPLVESSSQSGDVAAMMLQFGQPDEIARQLTVSGKKTIAAIVQGKFRSAFPDGLPTEASAKEGAPKDEKPADGADKQDEKKDGAAATPPPALKDSKTTSTLLVVCDTDWLFDDYSVRRMNFLGVQAAEPLNDNLAFASNALEFLAGSQDIISIRGKGNSIRPFNVVKRMEADANRQYQQQLTALEARIASVQTKLSELQGKKTESNRLVATPEVAKAIEEFQKQQAAMRSERRQIRAALREGIEALGNRLLLFNLLATPVLIGAFGVWFHLRRRC